ncbi:GNAT family N-acetyltransferase [Chloroflexota bacterium]
MMNINHYNADNTKKYLENLPKVESVGEINISNRIIESISLIYKSTGRLVVQRLNVEDSPALFDFYFSGLSEESRSYFPPYPLFSPPVNSAEELSIRITDWKEEDDWTVLKLSRDERIIGICLLKRYKTERPTSGLAVREEFQQIGLGFLLQTIINEQARLLDLKKLYVTLAQDNIDSLHVHKKCGFKQTDRLVPHYGYRNGEKVIDRQDIEMVIEF